MVYMHHVQFVVNINVLVLIDTLELVDEFCHYSQKKPTANGKRVSVASLITIQNTGRSIAKLRSRKTIRKLSQEVSKML